MADFIGKKGGLGDWETGRRKGGDWETGRGEE